LKKKRSKKKEENFRTNFFCAPKKNFKQKEIKMQK